MMEKLAELKKKVNEVAAIAALFDQLDEETIIGHEIITLLGVWNCLNENGKKRLAEILLRTCKFQDACLIYLTEFKNEELLKLSAKILKKTGTANDWYGINNLVLRYSKDNSTLCIAGDTDLHVLPEAIERLVNFTRQMLIDFAVGDAEIESDLSFYLFQRIHLGYISGKDLNLVLKSLRRMTYTCKTLGDADWVFEQLQELRESMPPAKLSKADDPIVGELKTVFLFDYAMEEVLAKIRTLA